MSGPVSAPNSVVYECESPPRYKKRRLSPIEESPQLFRRITRSQSSVAASQKRSRVHKIASKLKGEEFFLSKRIYFNDKLCYNGIL